MNGRRPQPSPLCVARLREKHGMVAEDGLSNRQSRRGTTRSLRRVGGWAGILLALGLLASAALPVSAGAAKDGGHQVAGGGKTIIEGRRPRRVPVAPALA